MVQATCRVTGSPDLYYYSTTFSGGPGVSPRIIVGGAEPNTTHIRSGAFDVPEGKCPPSQEGGSSSEVTARSAPSLLTNTGGNNTTNQLITKEHHYQGFTTAATSTTTHAPAPASDSNPSMLSLFSTHVPNFTTPYGVVTPNSTPGSSPAQHRTTSSSSTKPVTIPATNNRATKVVNGFTISMSQKPLDTPPMTPDSSLGGDDRWLEDGDGDLKFLREVFPDPESVRAAGRYARGVSIAQEGVTFEGFVLALPGQVKTLYVCGKGAESVQLRESIVALLDLADEHLGCNAFVIALERESPALAGLIHSLMYVSGQVVSRPPFRVDDRWVLVGIEV